MKKMPKLTKSDRFEIKILLDKQYSCRAIARSMRRSPTTIAYEVSSNGGRKGYNPINAGIYARTKRKNTRQAWSKIEQSKELREYIISGLQNHWNPDEIAGRMKEDAVPFYASKTAIYDWLRSVYGQRYCPLLYSKQYDKKKRKKKTERVMIPNRVPLTMRPVKVNDRTESGHWERDTVVSRKGCRGGISVGSERVSRFIDATKVSSMSSAEHMEVIEQQKKRYLTNSVTFDNGIENRAHETLHIPTYFCEPYSSWEKGGVENANRMIRRYFPKGTNFRTVSQQQIDAVVFLINSKPRKILGYKTALEVASACGILQDINLSGTVLIGG